MITAHYEPSEIEILHSVLAELAANGVSLETPALGVTLIRLPAVEMDIADNDTTG